MGLRYCVATGFFCVSSGHVWELKGLVYSLHQGSGWRPRPRPDSVGQAGGPHRGPVILSPSAHGDGATESLLTRSRGLPAVAFGPPCAKNEDSGHTWGAAAS